MKKLQSIILAMLFIVLFISKANAVYEKGVIQDLAVDPNGVYISLVGVSMFPGLTCNQNSAEALLPIGATNYNAMLSYLLTMYSTGKSVKIWASKCPTSNPIAEIEAVRDGRYPNY